MLSKKFALGFGIAVLFPMLVYYGVTIFSPPPNWADYEVKDYYQRIKTVSPAEKARLEKEQVRLDKIRAEKEKSFGRNFFYISVFAGISAVIIGSFLAVPAVGTGLMFGGIILIVQGYSFYWGELANWIRFLSLLVAFMILIFIGYRKLATQEK